MKEIKEALENRVMEQVFFRLSQYSAIKKLEYLSTAYVDSSILESETKSSKVEKMWDGLDLVLETQVSTDDGIDFYVLYSFKDRETRLTDQHSHYEYHELPRNILDYLNHGQPMIDLLNNIQLHIQKFFQSKGY
jgi:hypothetical protein